MSWLQKLNYLKYILFWYVHSKIAEKHFKYPVELGHFIYWYSQNLRYAKICMNRCIGCIELGFFFKGDMYLYMNRGMTGRGKVLSYKSANHILLKESWISCKFFFQYSWFSYNNNINNTFVRSNFNTAPTYHVFTFFISLINFY